jgi:hypothetical protein
MDRSISAQITLRLQRRCVNEMAIAYISRTRPGKVLYLPLLDAVYHPSNEMINDASDDFTQNLTTTAGLPLW